METAGNTVNAIVPEWEVDRFVGLRHSVSNSASDEGAVSVAGGSVVGVGHASWGRPADLGKRGRIMAIYGDGECPDGPEGCRGEVVPRETLSGSGDSYYRCDYHYERYYERVQPAMDDIARRYPVMAPPDFDPLACGESWDDDGW